MGLSHLCCNFFAGFLALRLQALRLSTGISVNSSPLSIVLLSLNFYKIYVCWTRLIPFAQPVDWCHHCYFCYYCWQRDDFFPWVSEWSRISSSCSWNPCGNEVLSCHHSSWPYSMTSICLNASCHSACFLFSHPFMTNIYSWLHHHVCIWQIFFLLLLVCFDCLDLLSIALIQDLSFSCLSK